MRNFGTLKCLPAPIRTEGAYHNKKLGLISIVNSNGDTVVTVQDKNMFQKDVTIFYKIDGQPYSFAEYTQEIDWPGELFEKSGYSYEYKYTSDFALAGYLEQQSINIPEGYHIFNQNEFSRFWGEERYYHMYPFDKYFLDGYENSLIYDAESDVACYKTGYDFDNTSGQMIPKPNPYRNGGIAPIRLAKNNIVVPMSHLGRKKLPDTVEYLSGGTEQSGSIILNLDTPGLTVSKGEVTENGWRTDRGNGYRSFTFPTYLFPQQLKKYKYCFYDFSVSSTAGNRYLSINGHTAPYNTLKGVNILNLDSEYTTANLWVDDPQYITSLNFTYRELY